MSNGEGVPEEDLLSWDKELLVLKLRRAEEEKIAALVQRGRLIGQVNRQLQEHLREIRELKAVNSRLREENRELGDLCCFLDGERLKVKRLAGEWQRLGRHALRALREDVGDCLGKLAELGRLQGALASENGQLKELCLALDAESRARGDPSPAGSSDLGVPCGTRDLGDGSSSVGSPDQPRPSCCPGD
ncbi:coiled-coil domain-containing protein 85B [Pristis pectinata]|uniref:coiled-coil domain-containing protein 85B n=1 Tax=Pristis pectinata TaxID=685728 RepID=UPI00223D2C86|nr:coiled-coil domain-containing protein 85B [Pristis pectinata]